MKPLLHNKLLGMGLAGSETLFHITFDSGTGLDPVITGGTNIEWWLDGSVVATGGTPSPALSSAGRYTITMDDYAAVTGVDAVSDNVSSVENWVVLKGLVNITIGSNQLPFLDPSYNPNLEIVTCNNTDIKALNITTLTKLTSCAVFTAFLTEIDPTNCPDLVELKIHRNLITAVDVTQSPLIELFFANKNELSNIDLSKSTALTSFRCNDNPAIDVDSIVDDIDANKNILAAGLSVNMGGTCPSVSLASETKILVMVAAPYNFTWTRNYP